MAWNDLKTYIGVAGTEDDAFIQTCYNDAVILLTTATESAFRPIPQSVMDRMILEVGNELYDRKNAPSAQSQYTQFDGGSVPVRAPRDPLYKVRTILSMYVVPF